MFDCLLMALVLCVAASYKAVCKVPCGAASVLAGAETSIVRLCEKVRVVAPPRPAMSPCPSPKTPSPAVPGYASSKGQPSLCLASSCSSPLAQDGSAEAMTHG